MAFLQTSRDGAVLTVTMSQPETRNALTGNTAIEEIVQACADIAADRSVRAVILTGEGPVFSSGGNVKSMQRYFQEQLTPEAIREEYRNGIQRVPKALYHLDVPVIAAVNGPAIGAGMDLTCMCDIRIASDRASFAESFVKVGIVPGDGGAWLLTRLVGPARALELLLTGRVLSGAEAAEWGLVNRAIDGDDLEAETYDLAERLATGPQLAQRLIKQAVYAAERTTFEAHCDMISSYMAIAQAHGDFAGAVDSLIDKRQPTFDAADPRPPEVAR